MTDSNMLKDYIKNSGYRIYYIANKLGISYQGLLNKINNKFDFTQSEIIVLTDLLKIDPETRDLIFFAKNVDNLSTHKKKKRREESK